ncbi:hypothetical protein GH714_022288 [Hevea brasiliensis]|uniref:Uncharacterized protein n=1 Tax=Hevea brasiliensis TaxID=3981 RepID=A0A6A6MP08_HEVBR|nr:hypothetical protein GH714_022288 [Hevea brasiliensis]
MQFNAERRATCGPTPPALLGLEVAAPPAVMLASGLDRHLRTAAVIHYNAAICAAIPAVAGAACTAVLQHRNWAPVLGEATRVLRQMSTNVSTAGKASLLDNHSSSSSANS